MKKVSALTLPALSFLFLAKSAFAADSIDTCPDTASWANLCALNFGNVFSTVITLAFIGASLIALAFLVFGGIKWITSGGDKSGVESARNMIVAALVGLVITFLSYFILQILFNFFGLGSINSFELPQFNTTPADASAPPPNP